MRPLFLLRDGFGVLQNLKIFNRLKRLKFSKTLKVGRSLLKTYQKIFRKRVDKWVVLWYDKDTNKQGGNKMIYFRVKPKADQTPIYNASKTKYLGFLIANELITPCEAERVYHGNIPCSCLETVEINKNKTYWCFGARFECKS